MKNFFFRFIILYMYLMLYSDRFISLLTFIAHITAFYSVSAAVQVNQYTLNTQLHAMFTVTANISVSTVITQLFSELTL